MSKREIIKILETIGYEITFRDEWSYIPNKSRMGDRGGCISFYKEKKTNFIKFNYGPPMLLSELTHEILFEYILRKSPKLKNKIREWKLNKLV